MMFDETGCAGVSIGRGAFYNPWIFRTRAHYLQTRRIAAGTGISRSASRVMRRHMDLMVEVFGEDHGCRMFRKIGPWYSKRFGPANDFNKRIVKLSKHRRIPPNSRRLPRMARQFLEADGQLKPNYRPPPMVASFMQDPAVVSRTEIPVPKGPVEVW